MIFQKSPSLNNLIKQIFRFGGIGLSAMLLHWSIAVIFISHGHPPLLSNLIAFIIAFQASYLGHRYWTFKGSQEPHSKVFVRFLIIALLGFTLNQCLFSYLLKYSYIPYPLALMMVLLLTAIHNFILSKFWAFKA